MRQVINLFPNTLDPADSYGIVGRRLAEGLRRLGMHVNVMAPGADPAEPIHPALGGVVLGLPTGFAAHGPLLKHGPVVALTMFEADGLPDGWAAALNQVDRVVVPAHFNALVFRAAGVRVPIDVVPLGVDDVYEPAPRAAGRPYTFLAFGDRGRRKGLHWALMAFVRAFGEDESVRLIVKSRAALPGHPQLHITNPNIHIIQQDMTPQELYRLYLQADCLIFASHGEGFGLPAREFAATGGLSIATDWSGLAEGIALWGWPLPISGLEPAYPETPYAGCGQWAVPDLDALVGMLRRAAAQGASHRLVTAAYVRRAYSWAAFSQGVLNAWQAAAGVPARPDPLDIMTIL